MVHVSDMAWERVAKPANVVKMGQTVKVQVTEIDEKGRVNASMKVLMEKPENYEEPIRDYSNNKLFTGGRSNNRNNNNRKKDNKKETKKKED
jgi:polyribonucleotide nucleotidyltransferase